MAKLTSPKMPGSFTTRCCTLFRMPSLPSIPSCSAHEALPYRQRYPAPVPRARKQACLLKQVADLSMAVAW